jgi:O-antigen ligase
MRNSPRDALVAVVSPILAFTMGFALVRGVKEPFYLLGAGIAAAVIVSWPHWGGYMTLLLSPIKSSALTTGVLSITRVVGLGTVLATLAHLMIKRRGIIRTGIEGPVLLIAFGMSLSFFRSPDPGEVGKAILSLASLYALVFVIVNSAVDELRLKEFVLAFMVSGVYPVAQALSQWTQSSRGDESIVRVSGSFTLPTGLGGFLMPLILMAFPMILYPGFSRLLRSLIGCLLGGAIAALIYSASRAAWIGVVAGSGLLLLAPNVRRLMKGRRAVAIVVPLSLVAATWIFWPLVQVRLVRPIFELLTTGTSTPSVLARRYEFPAGVEIVLDNYFLGTGIGNYGRDVQRYRNLYGTSDIPSVPHNLLLFFFGEVGIVGAVGFLWLVVWLYRRVRIGYRDLAANAQSLSFYTYLGVVSSLVGFVSYVTFHSGFFSNEIWIVIAFLIVTTRLAKTPSQ